MPMSAAAMDGIAANGHRWRHHLSLGGQTEVMGTMTEETPDADVEACALSIVGRVRAFADRVKKNEPNLAAALEGAAEQLEFVADCGIVEVREAMSSLYDQFDYSRICVVS